MKGLLGQFLLWEWEGTARFRRASLIFVGQTTLLLIALILADSVLMAREPLRAPPFVALVPRPPALPWEEERPSRGGDGNTPRDNGHRILVGARPSAAGRRVRRGGHRNRNRDPVAE